MKRFQIRFEGFTILELFIFMLIIGILVGIAIPVYNANLYRAKAVEAETTMQILRQFLKINRSIDKSFPVSPAFINIIELNDLNISTDELDGRFYDARSYYYKGITGQDYELKAAHLGLPTFRMDMNGDFSRIESPLE